MQPEDCGAKSFPLKLPIVGKLGETNLGCAVTTNCWPCGGRGDEVTRSPALLPFGRDAHVVQLSAESATGVPEVTTKARSQLVAPTGAMH